MKFILVAGIAMIKWHTLNDVFEAFYNQPHSKGEIQLGLYQGTQKSNIRSMHQKASYSKVLSAMFNFSVRQSLAEEKYSTILQTRRNALKLKRASRKFKVEFILLYKSQWYTGW